MPYPNSNSPITIALSQRFGSPPGSYGVAPATLAAELLSTTASGTLAFNRGIIAAGDTAAEDHINNWPAPQQLFVRKLLAKFVNQGRAVTFNWEVDTDISFSVISFGPGLGVGITFRSPMNEP